MRWLFSLIALTVIAVAIGVTARYAQGYVLFVTPRTRVEMSLTLFILLLLLAFALFYAIARVLRQLWRLPARVRTHRQQRQRDRAQEAKVDPAQAEQSAALLN